MKTFKIIFVFLIFILSVLLGLSTFEVISNDLLSDWAKKWIVISLIVGCAFTLIGLVLGNKDSSSTVNNDKSNTGPKF